MSTIKELYLEEVEEELTFEEAKYQGGDEYEDYKNQEILIMNSR